MRNGSGRWNKSAKASEKKERRNRKKQQTEQDRHTMPDESSQDLSPEEVAVLDVFRKFRMSPGQMLCFSTADIVTYREPLAQLANTGFLVAEKFQGGYSLTNVGFAAIRETS